MTIRVLPSSRARDAQSNLDRMIEAGKKSHAFGPVDWDAPVWLYPEVKLRPATEGQDTSGSFYFLDRKGATRGAVAGVPMQKPFIDFLKAALRLSEDSSSKCGNRYLSYILAGRPLHDALADVDYDPCRALPRHFEAAAKAFVSRLAASSAYKAGSTLAQLAAWIDQYGIGRVHIGWKNLLKPPPTSDRHTEEAARTREYSLPSEAALDALPMIANMVVDPIDVLRMRIIELLCCGGWRMNEVLQLPADCEVTENYVRNGKPMLDASGSQVVRYGIRYFGLKKFGYSIKWIPTPMVDVAKRAIRDILDITKPARGDAVWMSENPGRHPIFRDIDPEQLLTSRELAELINMSSTQAIRWWLLGHKVPMRQGLDGGSAKRIRVRAGDAEAALLRTAKAIPKNMKQPLHENLFLIRTNGTHRKKADLAGSVEMMTATKVRDFITGRLGTPTIFSKFGFTEPDGSKIKVRSHAFRHWTNTLAQEGGLSQELIARWSGRKDMSQNAVYDHISGSKLAEKVRAMAEAGEVVGQIVRVRDALPLANRSEFMKTQVATAHFTEIGLCVHDWSLIPCEVHGQCATCVEHVVQKGNATQSAEVRRQLAEIEDMLSIVEKEDAEGTYGAARWLISHRQRRDGLLVVLAIHNDVGIADGTLVHIGNKVSASQAGPG